MNTYLKPLLLFSLCIFSTTIMAQNSKIIWKASYYNPTPNKENISQQYCNIHNPGTFIGSVNKQLLNGAITSKKIKLKHFTFHQQIVKGIYLMHGSVIASSLKKDSHWTDHIHYYIYKLTPHGRTQGIWTSGDCKGLFIGEVLK